jgi:hypothetical protein
MQDVWHLDHEHGYEYALSDILRHFDPMIACRAIDERLEELVIAHSVLGNPMNTTATPRT